MAILIEVVSPRPRGDLPGNLGQVDPAETDALGRSFDKRTESQWITETLTEEQAIRAAQQHDCRKVRILREIARANSVIEAADAVRVEDDGFQWVDTARLPADFADYYAGLTSTGYALGALQ